MINERISKLRKMMMENKIDAYIVPSSDPHKSEYLADYYKTRAFITGFTGSAGTAVITLDKSGVWTDGRYFIQAEKELSNSEVKLYKLGIDETIEDFLLNNMKSNSIVAFNGKNLSVLEFENLKNKLKDISFKSDVDFIGEIWNSECRPEKPFSNVYIYEEKYSGESTKDRLHRIREMMKSENIDYHFIGSLDDIAYLLNIRANDIACNPVVISYLLISNNDCVFYVDNSKLSNEVVDYLKSNDITIKDYNDINNDINHIEEGKTIYFEPAKTNVSILHSIKENVKKINGLNLSSKMKTHKNKIEIKNTKNVYIRDGVALVKYLNWLESEIKKCEVTEMVASEKLLEFRKQGDLFIEDSFPSISAYGPNASMPHYSPSHENPVVIKNKGLYLIDSGAHYLDGTTDITRTIAVGEISDEESYHYTLVLKAHIALMFAKFLEGTNGAYLDAFTRYGMWREYINYNHGTGHGVGHVLNVHEGPQRIAQAGNQYPMEVGMVTSNEPGIYISGSHGIRIESIVVCVEEKSNEYGKWLGFDNLTFVPIDTRPINKKLLSEEEISWLNEYNKECFNKLSPYLKDDDLKYLEEQCKEI